MYYLDLLNDCLDQIDDFLDGQVDYDESQVVDFLRENNYNVEEAIDFIMDNGAAIISPIEKPPAPKIDIKTIATKPSYTLPPSTFLS